MATFNSPVLKRVCVEPRSSVLNMTLPAFAAERRRTPLLLSIDVTEQTNGRTDGHPTFT